MLDAQAWDAFRSEHALPGMPGMAGQQSYTSLPPTMSFLRRNDTPKIPPARNDDAQYEANRAALLGTGGGGGGYPVSMATSLR